MIKIILRNEEKTDGTCPLALRITKDRKSSYIYLGFSIHSKDWDADKQRVKKSHPNSARLNNFLNELPRSRASRYLRLIYSNNLN
jgi:integrase/recombinase XerD